MVKTILAMKILHVLLYLTNFDHLRFLFYLVMFLFAFDNVNNCYLLSLLEHLTTEVQQREGLGLLALTYLKILIILMSFSLPKHVFDQSSALFQTVFIPFTNMFEHNFAHYIKERKRTG